MIYENTDFPFDEIKDNGGDYFNTIDAAIKHTGLTVNNVWSVVSDDHMEKDNWMVYIYGPSHHYCNILGYVVTKESHDNETYYLEEVDFA